MKPTTSILEMETHELGTFFRILKLYSQFWGRFHFAF